MQSHPGRTPGHVGGGEQNLVGGWREAGQRRHSVGRLLVFVELHVKAALRNGTALVGSAAMASSKALRAAGVSLRNSATKPRMLSSNARSKLVGVAGSKALAFSTKATTSVKSLSAACSC